MNSGFEQLRELCGRYGPSVALVLGSGLHEVAAAWPTHGSAAFSAIPGLPGPGVPGHRGQIGLHELHGRAVLVFHGRIHYYEGHPLEAVARPIQLAHELGIRSIILTNAAGGIGPTQEPGSLMALEAHINCFRDRWWPDVHRTPIYSERLRSLLLDAASRTSVILHTGVYAGVPGPNYETPAEVRTLRILGADAVGMSTVHEAETAYQLGLEVAAISCIANRAAGLSPEPLSHGEVLQQVREGATRFGQLIQETVSRI